MFNKKILLSVCLSVDCLLGAYISAEYARTFQVYVTVREPRLLVTNPGL